MSRLAEMGAEIGKLCQKKNEAYGDSFAQSHKVLEALYPNGIKPHQYSDALAIVRVVDKLFRIATKKDAFGESPWKDIAGYGILGAVKDEHESEPMVLGAERYPWHIDHLEEQTDTFMVFKKHNVEEEFNQKVAEETSVSKSCSTCIYHLNSMDEMPCKKCWSVPYLPHWKRQ